MFINSKITDITIKTLFTNPENNQEIVSFIEIDNNIINSNICKKPYGWYETRDISFTINDQTINNIILVSNHNYSHEIGISGTFTEDELVIENTNNIIFFEKKNKLVIGNNNIYSKEVDLEYDCLYKDSITNEILLSYKMKYQIIEKSIDNIIS